MIWMMKSSKKNCFHYYYYYYYYYYTEFPPFHEQHFHGQKRKNNRMAFDCFLTFN